MYAPVRTLSYPSPKVSVASRSAPYERTNPDYPKEVPRKTEDPEIARGYELAPGANTL
jgi:hypothetical protein